MIMPAYNAGQTIRRAVSSTLRSLPRDSELVILDDASKDDTFCVLQEIAHSDERLVIHRLEQNAGAANALQQLLNVTDSEFVARMDSDDFVLPGRFTTQMKTVSSGKASIAFMTVLHFWPTARRRIPLLIPTLPLAISKEAMPFNLLMSNPVAHSTMFARRSSIDSLGGYRSVPAEDYDLWMRAALEKVAMVRLAQPGIAYRHHPGQVTASDAWTAAAAQDPATAAVHAELSLGVLGTEHLVFDKLRDSRVGPDAVEPLKAFLSDVERSSMGLLGSERLLLKRQFRRLARRIEELSAQASENRTTSEPNDPGKIRE
ncbi:glycosyltransferase family 2 protein [Arthrobacter sp. M-10]|uniref:glycosyltransferase family 2 protein n=1 Tax=Arthrobacter sp. M-10 TaxID=3233037 RepID=UPI003F8F7A2C